MWRENSSPGILCRLRRWVLEGENLVSCVNGIRTVDQRSLDPPRLCPARAVLDAILAAILLFFLTPVLLTIALAVSLTSRGPVFFVQDRIGRHGQLFPFVKFRTMNRGAHLLRSEVLGTPDEDMLERYQDDPRITSVGKFLRRWSVDELPQLLNVVAGHMAIVGPRPILEDEECLLEPRHRERHDVKPGLTGLWQVSGRKETSWEERMDLDVEYVRSRSFSGDVSIMARTAGVVVRGDGAC